MNSEFEKRFPLISILMMPYETLSKEEFYELLDSLSIEALTQLVFEFVLLVLIEASNSLSPEESKALSMMANYKNN